MDFLFQKASILVAGASSLANEIVDHVKDKMVEHVFQKIDTKVAGEIQHDTYAVTQYDNFTVPRFSHLDESDRSKALYRSQELLDTWNATFSTSSYTLRSIPFDCVFALSYAENTIGLAGYIKDGNKFTISLIVAPAYKRQGYGSQLVANIIRFIKNKTDQNCKFIVECPTLESQLFIKKNGFTPETETSLATFIKPNRYFTLDY